MKRCSDYADSLALAAGGDLDQGSSRPLSRHLEECPACQAHLLELKDVISTGRDYLKAEGRLPEAVVSRLAAEAAEAVGGRGSWQERFMLLPGSLTMQRPSLALAAALAVALLALPLTIRGGRVPAPGEATPVRLDMRVDGGAVRIAWRDGRDKAYTVRRSVDAAGVASGEAHVVRGNVWVDDRPESSPIVFYTVE